MFGIGITELILIAVVAVIALGPDRLPEVARTLGKMYAELRKAGDEVRRSVSEAVNEPGGRGEGEGEGKDGGRGA